MLNTLIKVVLLFEPILQLLNIVLQLLVGFLLVYQILNENILDVLCQLGERVIQNTFHVSVALGCRVEAKILSQFVEFIMTKFLRMKLL